MGELTEVSKMSFKTKIHIPWNPKLETQFGRYGQPCRVGLSRMNIPAGLLTKLQNEDDLEETR